VIGNHQEGAFFVLDLISDYFPMEKAISNQCADRLGNTVYEQIRFVVPQIDTPLHCKLLLYSTKFDSHLQVFFSFTPSDQLFCRKKHSSFIKYLILFDNYGIVF